MARIGRGRSWESRDSQCPRRSAGLSHVQDGDPRCVFCDQLTYGPDATVGEVEDYGGAILDEGTLETRLQGYPHSDFTRDQNARLGFLRYLRENGRV